jgi:hypothetical protein
MIRDPSYCCAEAFELDNVFVFSFDFEDGMNGKKDAKNADTEEEEEEDDDDEDEDEDDVDVGGAAEDIIELVVVSLADEFRSVSVFVFVDAEVEEDEEDEDEEDIGGIVCIVCVLCVDVVSSGL